MLLESFEQEGISGELRVRSDRADGYGGLAGELQEVFGLGLVEEVLDDGRAVNLRTVGGAESFEYLNVSCRHAGSVRVPLVGDLCLLGFQGSKNRRPIILSIQSPSKSGAGEFDLEGLHLGADSSDFRNAYGAGVQLDGEVIRVGGSGRGSGLEGELVVDLRGGVLDASSFSSVLLPGGVAFSDGLSGGLDLGPGLGSISSASGWRLGPCPEGRLEGVFGGGSLDFGSTFGLTAGGSLSFLGGSLDLSGGDRVSLAGGSCSLDLSGGAGALVVRDHLSLEGGRVSLSATTGGVDVSSGSSVSVSSGGALSLSSGLGALSLSSGAGSSVAVVGETHRVLSALLPGGSAESSVYPLGDVSHTLLAGGERHALAIGNLEFLCGLGSTTFTNGLNVLSLSPLGGFQGVVSVGGVSVSALSGSASISGLLGVSLVSSAGPVTLASTQTVLLSGAPSPPDIGGVVCAGSLDPLTGKPFGLYGVGSRSVLVI